MLKFIKELEDVISINEMGDVKFPGGIVEKSVIPTLPAELRILKDTDPKLGTIQTGKCTSVHLKGELLNRSSFPLQGLLIKNPNGQVVVELDADGNLHLKGVFETTPPEVTTLEKLCVLVGQQVLFQATFTDIGWCDKHSAVWDFGDCNKQRAVVTETSEIPVGSEAPIGKGSVEICQTYEHCGVYKAKVYVSDGQGGVGEATTVVNAVSLENSSFEDGYRIINQPESAQNLVVNGWTPYQALFPGVDTDAFRKPREVKFTANQFIVRDGKRSQQIDFRGTVQAGIYQTICTNKDWGYEFYGFYYLPRDVSGKARIGIDPNGGADPSSSGIIWAEGEAGDTWRSLTVRATALQEKVTLYIGGVDRHGNANSIYWDRVQLCCIQPIKKTM